MRVNERAQAVGATKAPTRTTCPHSAKVRRMSTSQLHRRTRVRGDVLRTRALQSGAPAVADGRNAQDEILSPVPTTGTAGYIYYPYTVLSTVSVSRS